VGVVKVENKCEKTTIKNIFQDGIWGAQNVRMTMTNKKVIHLDPWK
jgi:glucose uptake protein GlcU